MRRLASLLILVSACGGSARFRAEHAGTGIAAVSPRGAPVAAGAPIAVGRGAYDLRLHFDLPRAQLVEWQVACPGAASEGSAGEPFEAYRTRRLAQLRADRARDAETAGAVTSVLVGALAPSVTASARTGPVRADAEVSGQAAGAAAGAAVAASVDQEVQLAPGDVGAGPVETVVHLVTTAPGSCTVTAVADDPDVTGRFDVIHIRDLVAEATAHDAAVAAADQQARATLTTQLVAFGGDPGLRARQRAAADRARADAERARAETQARLDADAAAHAEAELRITRAHEAELAARADAELRIREERAARLRAVELDVRARWSLLLIGWGADVHYRERVQAEHDARIRAAMELDARRLRIALEIRARWRLLLISWGADAEWRLHEEERARTAELRQRAALEAAIAERHRQEALALELSLHARSSLVASLVALGARERPPMPPRRPETPGPAPFDGATWIAGGWQWSAESWQWQWTAGGWSDQSGGFGETGGDVAVQVAPAVIETPVVDTVVVTPAVIETVPTPTTIIVDPHVRDHRSTITVTPPHVRDHRPPRAEPAPPRAEPHVRDHRSEDKPKVRDHR